MEGTATPEIKVALKKLNEQTDPQSKTDPKANFQETFESLRDVKVYSGEKVALIISDYRKFEFSFAELGLKAAKSAMPETAVKQ